MYFRRMFAFLIFIMLIVYVCTYELTVKSQCIPNSCNELGRENNAMGYVCSCHDQIDLTKVVCREHRYKSDVKPFNVTVHEYSPYIRKKIVFNGLNNDIPFEFVSVFLHGCSYAVASLAVVNFCSVNSEKSRQLNTTKVIELRQNSNIKVLNITNSCLSSITCNNEKGFLPLEELHLSFNRLTQIPGFKRDVHMLRVLDVSNNFISSISKNDFKYLLALKSLNISYNQLSILPKDLLFKLYLEVLDLSYNLIFKLPFVFKHSFYLKRLYLNNNNFTILPENVFNNTQNLIYLDLSNNKLNYTDSYFKKLLKIEILYLNNVGLSENNNELFFENSAMTLKILSLTQNDFKQIPLIHLETNSIFLDLRWNKITTLHLPPTIRIYYSFNTSLDVSHNCIERFDTYIPHSRYNYFFRETVLHTFRCSFCCLKFMHPLMFFQLHNLLDLSYNTITELNLTGISNNQPLTINVSHNQITHLLNKNYELWSNISVLDISHNNLISLVNLSITPNLRKLYVNNNSLSEFNFLIENLLSSNATNIRLAGNHWNCNCKTIALITKSPIFSDKHSLTCVKDGLLYHLADIDRLCSREKLITDLTLMWLLIPISVIVTIIIALSLYFKFKAEIMYFMFSRGICLKFVTEKDIDNDKVYDAFISYCHEDEDWVADFLMTGLETGSPAYKLCLHNRDWLGGEYIPDQIVKSVQSSRRTIIVLTENFVKSNWSRMEFDVAYQQTMKDKIPRLIVVLPGDVPDLSKVSNEFKTFVTLTTYIQASKPYFWRKLRSSMPRTMNLLGKKNWSKIENLNL